jgi:hypothetical protein
VPVHTRRIVQGILVVGEAPTVVLAALRHYATRKMSRRGWSRTGAGGTSSFSWPATSPSAIGSSVSWSSLGAVAHLDDYFGMN